MKFDENYVGTPIEEIPADDLYERCNFMRVAPDLSGPEPRGWRLFPGDDTPRTFINCNLMNCEPPPGSQLLRCNTWLADADVDGGVHEQVIVDGEVVAESRKRVARNYGKYNPETGEYEIRPTPLEAEQRPK